MKLNNLNEKGNEKAKHHLTSLFKLNNSLLDKDEGKITPLDIMKMKTTKHD